jgi:hypothetical protein
MKWISILLALTLAGCAGDPPLPGRDYVDTTAIRGDLRVALLPFENLSNQPNAGLIVAQLAATELYSQGLFQLIEESQLRRTLKDRKVNIARLAEHSHAAAVARQLGVDAVLLGSVSEYGYQHGLHEEPVVGINARLVDASGNVLWASSHSGRGRGYLRRESVNQTAQRVVAEMIGQLRTALGR